MTTALLRRRALRSPPLPARAHPRRRRDQGASHQDHHHQDHVADVQRPVVRHRGPVRANQGLAVGEIDPGRSSQCGHHRYPLAPRNANGKVEYRTTFTIIKPVDMSKGRPMMLYNVPNRGNHSLPGAFLFGSDPGDGFIYKLGHTMVWSGWQGDQPIADGQHGDAGRHRRSDREAAGRLAGDEPDVAALRQRLPRLRRDSAPQDAARKATTLRYRGSAARRRRSTRPRRR